VTSGRLALSAHSHDSEIVGAVAAGLECLRRAVSEAADCGDMPLLAQALVWLGGGLISAAQSRDQEAAAVLHEALNRARAVDARHRSPRPARSWLTSMSNLGRPQRAQLWLWRAEQWAGDDAAELASIQGNRGRSLADQGHHINTRKSSRPEAWLRLSRTYVRGEPWPWDRA